MNSPAIQTRRYAFYLLLTAVSVIWAGRVLLLDPLLERFVQDTTLLLSIDLLFKLLIFVVPALGYTLFVPRKKALSVFMISSGRKVSVTTAASVAGVLVALLVSTPGLLADGEISLVNSGIPLLILIPVRIIAIPLIEELFFRGFVQSETGQLHSKSVAVLVQSVCFALMLQIPLLVLFGPVPSIILASAGLFLTGIFLGILTLKTGSIVPAAVTRIILTAAALLFR